MSRRGGTRGPGRWFDMIRLALSIIVLLAIAALIILNLGNLTTFSLFGYVIHDLNVVAVAIGGFIFGVLYSFLYYVISTVGRSRRAKLKERQDRIQERERVVAKREEDLARKATEGDKD